MRYYAYNFTLDIFWSSHTSPQSIKKIKCFVKKFVSLLFSVIKPQQSNSPLFYIEGKKWRNYSTKLRFHLLTGTSNRAGLYTADGNSIWVTRPRGPLFSDVVQAQYGNKLFKNRLSKYGVEDPWSYVPTATVAKTTWCQRSDHAPIVCRTVCCPGNDTERCPTDDSVGINKTLLIQVKQKQESGRDCFAFFVREVSFALKLVSA
ncbi:hypothetical protein AVEN_87383-1 [Araneus ventricosus]|uniref:Uncharacterized protein n=1 Tax=Araneus ventricosus TaxID=182803 RepID=A0A4Y2IE91_ARAVE|nr:hypothetical protein AVEN_87383-1 [Araneus ventricosus]